MTSAPDLQACRSGAGKKHHFQHIELYPLLLIMKHNRQLNNTCNATHEKLNFRSNVGSNFRGKAIFRSNGPCRLLKRHCPRLCSPGPGVSQSDALRLAANVAPPKWRPTLDKKHCANFFSFRGRAWTIQHWCSKHAWVFHQNLPPQLISAAGSELFSGMTVAVLALRCRAAVTWLACERFGLLCYGKDSCPESLDCCDLSFWPVMQVRCLRIGGCTRAKCSDVYGSSRGVVRSSPGLISHAY